MYNQAFLLVDNPLNRYILRPGASGLVTSADGSLTLYLQAERPEGVPEGNWLPAPPGPFSLALRTYLPKSPILAGTWFPPGIKMSR